MKPSLTLALTVLVYEPCVATIKEVDGCEHASECVDHYWRMIWLLIGLSIVVYIASLIWTCWVSNRVRKKYCYLCEDLVPKLEWANGSHRLKCQNHRIHKEFLARLPTPYASIVCPDCSETLKLWPNNRGPLYFTCDGENCIYEGYELRNTGDTRYNCFEHNFNLCKTCVESHIKWTNRKSQLLLSETVLQDSEVPKRPMRKISTLKSVKVIHKNNKDNAEHAQAHDQVQVVSAAKTTGESDNKSAETLTEDNSSAAKNKEASAETLVDPKATDEDAFTNIQTIPEDAEASQNDTAEGSSRKISNTSSTSNKKGKWSRSRSYAHAVDT